MINCCTFRRTVLETISFLSLGGAVNSPCKFSVNAVIVCDVWMKAFWLSRPWHHLMHKKTSVRKTGYDLLSEQTSATWFGLLTSHLLWQPKTARKFLWLFVVLLQVFLSALCHFYAGHYLHILVSWVGFCMWKVTVPPWNHLCFSSASSYEILISEKYHFPLENWSGLLQTVSAISGMMTLFLFLSGRATNPSLVWQLEIWLTYHLFVQGRTQGSDELLDMFWLEMTLASDTKRWGRSRKK